MKEKLKDKVRVIQTLIPARLDRSPWSGFNCEGQSLEDIAKPLCAANDSRLSGVFS